MCFFFKQWYVDRKLQELYLQLINIYDFLSIHNIITVGRVTIRSGPIFL